MSELDAAKRRIIRAAEDALREEATRVGRAAERDARELHGPMRTASDIDVRTSPSRVRAEVQFDAVYNSSGERTEAIRRKHLRKELVASARRLERAVAGRVSRAL